MAGKVPSTRRSIMVSQRCLWLIFALLTLVACDETYERFGFHGLEFETKFGRFVLIPRPARSETLEIDGKTINISGPGQTMVLNFYPAGGGGRIKSVNLEKLIFQDPSHAWKLSLGPRTMPLPDAKAGGFQISYDHVPLQWVAYQVQIKLLIALADNEKKSLNLTAILKKRYKKADYNYITGNPNDILF